MKQQINWRRIALAYLIGGLILVALWFGLRSYLHTSSASLSSGAEPRLFAEELFHDFGRVQEGTVLEHEFVLVNKGAGRAVLNRKLCGSCADDTGSPTTILPAGDTVRIPVVVTTDDRSGSLKETVTLTTSDPSRPRIELTVSAVIVSK